MPSPSQRWSIAKRAAWLAVVALHVGLPTAMAELTSLRIQDYAAAPITGSVSGSSNAAYLARLNFMAEEPGGADRFFVNDLNGPLYILDRETRQFSTYLNFNGSGANPGLFDKFTNAFGYANGLVTFQFDPDYGNNGKFYTVHLEDPAAGGSRLPNNASVPGLNTAGYTATTAFTSPGTTSSPRHSVLIEWTDTNTSNATFEGTARELLRLHHNRHLHPLGDLIFSPTAGPEDPDWRVMYISVGDGGSGEMTGTTRLNPQRLDLMVGKILRIVPDLGEHTGTSTVSDNGRYRVPNDNPFVSVAGARDEIYANGLRNPHRMSWDVDPANPANNQLIADDIGLFHWEEVNIIHAGANYGYSLREGNQQLSATNDVSSLPNPENDQIPWQINGTTTNGTVVPTYPVIQYGHGLGGQNETFAGDAITSGFVYRGSKIPALYGKYLFGDITTGSLFYADYEDMLATDNGDSIPLPDDQIHTLDLLWDDPNDGPGQGDELYTTITSENSNPNYSVKIQAPMFQIVDAAYHARGGLDENLPGGANITDELGRADIRLQIDDAGELYILSKSDGMIRAIVGPELDRGDYNYDGLVDETDFHEWQTAFGGSVPVAGLGADGNADGVIDAADYVVWRKGAAAPGAGAMASKVPEPASLLSLLPAATIVCMGRRRQKWL